MQVSEALQIFGLESGHVTKSQVDEAYLRMARRLRDKTNPVNIHMMAFVDSAYKTLQKFDGPLINTLPSLGLEECLERAIAAVVHLEGIMLEVCGLWIWASGNTEHHKEALKAACYSWAPKKRLWYFRPDHHVGRKKNPISYSMDRIREKYGSTMIKVSLEADRQVRAYSM